MQKDISKAKETSAGTSSICNQTSFQNTGKVPTVLIVILNFNGESLLKKHLDSIKATDYANYDIVVVDNGSTDDSVKYVKENYSEIKLIKNEKNLGFGTANNVAMRKFPDYDYYAFLNNDMDVNSNWLEILVETAENDNEISAVGPKILYAKKRNGKRFINSAGVLVTKNYLTYDIGDGEPDSLKFNEIKEVGALCGGALLVRSEAFREVGGFDEKMFLYYEDIDLSLRLRSAGWKLIYNGNSVVYHDHMGTTSSWGSARRTYMTNINRIRTIRKLEGWGFALREYVRTPLLWVWSKISGKTMRELILKDSEEANW